MNKRHAQIAIIGAGTAGMAAYRQAKKSGRSVVLIQGGPYGTTCARVGCMPSKLLIAAADAAHSVAQATHFGVTTDGKVRIDGVRVMDRVRNERDRFVGFVLDSIAAIDDADKIHGFARFTSDTTLQVDDHTEVHADSIVIATGSSPVVPPMYKQLGKRVVVNDDVFDWDTLPKRVLVVGTGVIGLEIGQALARLGVQTCLINRSAGIGGLSDPQVRASAQAAFQAELDLRLETDVLDVALHGDEVQVTLKSAGVVSSIRVDYVLVATGRRPNVTGLALENTSLKLDDKGMPDMDPATLQLGTAAIFMAGDVTGSLPLLHEANDEGHIAGANAAAHPNIQPGARRAPLAIVFSDPQLAYAGMRFKDLPNTGVVVGQVSFANQGRARVILKNQGLLRVYAGMPNGEFLGAEMAGPAMEHIAHLLAWCVQQRLTVHEMLKMPFYHPVIEEGLRTALRHAVAELSAASND